MKRKVYKQDKIFWFYMWGRPQYKDQIGISIKLLWIVFLITDNYKNIDYIKRIYKRVVRFIYSLIEPVWQHS